MDTVLYRAPTTPTTAERLLRHLLHALSSDVKALTLALTYGSRVVVDDKVMMMMMMILMTYVMVMLMIVMMVVVVVMILNILVMMMIMIMILI